MILFGQVDREEMVRYHSAFSLEGFWQGYSNGIFDKSKTEGFTKERIWFVYGRRSFERAADCSLVRHMKYDGKIAWQPCIFSGCISVKEFDEKDDHTGISNTPSIPVDKLFIVIPRRDSRSGSGYRPRKIVDISDLLQN